MARLSTLLLAGMCAFWLAGSLGGRPASAAGATVPHWEQCGWGGGGFFWACAFHPSRDGVIYVGGDVGGVYKTEDKGRHWRFINNGLADYAVYALAVDRASPDTVYAGTVSGLCKSTDAGEHWQFLEQTSKGALAITSERGVSVRNIAVDPTDSSTLYAGTPDGRVLKSRDGGGSWTVVYTAGERSSVSAIVVADSDASLLLAASTAAGVLKSEDAGQTWTAVGTPGDARSVAVAKGDPDVMYAACAKDGVWKSTDRGKSWASVSGGLTGGAAITDVATDPRDPGTVFCAGEVGWDGLFYRSDNGGATWESVRLMKRDLDADPTLPADFAYLPEGMCSLSRPTNVAVNPLRPEELFISGNWRLCFSQDGGKSWEERDRGADITCVTDIRFCGGRTYVTAMDEGLLVSDDGGGAWRQLCPLKYDTALSGHQWRVHVREGGGTTRILSTCSPWAEPPNRVLISEDGGKTFAIAREGLPDYRPSVNCMWGQSYPRALAADPADPNVFYLGMDGDPEPAEGRTGGGVFKSVDGGYTWRQLPNQPGSRRMFYGLVVDPTDSERLYWGACAEGGGLYRSEDGGGTWQKVFDRETWVFNAAVSPSGVIYCPGKNLWRSADHGATWQRITEFSDDLVIVGLELHPADEDTIWFSKVSWGAGAAGGVYKTADGGKTWSEITGDLPYCKPTLLRFDASTGELWAGGVGLFKLLQ